RRGRPPSPRCRARARTAWTGRRLAGRRPCPVATTNAANDATRDGRSDGGATHRWCRAGARACAPPHVVVLSLQRSIEEERMGVHQRSHSLPLQGHGLRTTGAVAGTEHLAADQGRRLEAIGRTIRAIAGAVLCHVE